MPILRKENIMGFEALLGNEQLKENLISSLSRGHISHFYLLSGPEGSGKHTLAKLLAAAILCSGRDKPCFKCLACRKVMDGNHPDFITVDDPEKKTVTVDLIRSARADMYIQPNESDHKIYLFPRAQDMGLPGQNALLKVLEEPPKYGVFLLLTDNPDKLLPTVRSRCTELHLRPLREEVLRRELEQKFPEAEKEDLEAAILRSGGFLGQAAALLEGGGAIAPQTQDFAAAFAQHSSLELVRTLVPLEKWKRDPLSELLQQWLELMEEALVCRSGVRTVSALSRKLSSQRSSTELYEAAEILRKSLDYLQSNVSPAAVCGYLAWALR